MKTTIGLSLIITTSLQLNAQEPLSADQSDPNKLGWMQGFPPPEDKIISAIDGSFFKFPALRYSVCHMRQFMPTTEVPSALDNQYEFKQNLDDAIDKVTFTPWNSPEPMNWKESHAENYTDGILILHKGKIVYEKYFECLLSPKPLPPSFLRFLSR